MSAFSLWGTLGELENPEFSQVFKNLDNGNKTKWIDSLISYYG